jgi:ethanolamine permease
MDEKRTELEIDKVVEDVIAESGVDTAAFTPEDVEYLKERALKKPLKTIHIWSLAVGVVITGEYFGFNFALPAGGPSGLIVAGLLVSLLYLTWVLTLSELSVAIPFSGGPYAYGRRAAGKFLGFMMGWSFFLECLFATIGTGLATGAYVAFLFNKDNPSLFWTTAFAVLTVIVFFFIQVWGAREQAVIMLWLTYAAIAGLVWFWLGSIPGWETSNVLTKPLLPEGFRGLLGAVPFALWFLVIIETVALAPEEAEEPHHTIPVGMTLGQLTLIVLVIGTAFTVTAAYGNYEETGGVLFPLSFVFNKVYPNADWFVLLFGIVAVSGMIVSYNGMIYATSRQSYSLGRAGYFPKFLGSVDPTRRTPVASLALWSVVAIGFIIWGYWNATATATAVLISTFTALVWYVLAVACLFMLRKREADLPRPYRVPVFPWLPIFVALLSIFAAYYYGLYNKSMFWWFGGLYAFALVYYFLYARHRVEEHAPEEVAARVAQEIRARAGTESAAVPLPRVKEGPSAWTTLEWVAAVTMAVVILALVWLLAMAYEVIEPVSEGVGVIVMIVVLGLALAAVSAVSLVEVNKRTRTRRAIPKAEVVPPQQEAEAI